MSINPQSESGFVTRLPHEIRNAIYLELWRSCGLRQHIIWHGNGADRHFCRWPCTTEYEVNDRLQWEIEESRRRLSIPLGQNITKTHDAQVAAYGRQLQSPWMNHWACGKQAEQTYGLEAVIGFTTSEVACWKKSRVDKQHLPPKSPYLPMLLSCKLISQQCIQSIYESTTFVFTDLRAIQMFFGYCQLHPAMKAWPKLGVTPPGFFKYARKLELSLSPDFPALLLCANLDIPGIVHRHNVYDFHWLRLNQFQNLQTLNIWISARSTTWSIEDGKHSYDFTGITELDVDALGKAVAPLECVASVTLSTPLGLEMGPEDGYVEGVCVSARVYKRGAGDRFHPPLHLIEPGGTFDNVIYTSPSREVRLSRNGGTYLVMKGV